MCYTYCGRMIGMRQNKRKVSIRIDFVSHKNKSAEIQVLHRLSCTCANSVYTDPLFLCGRGLGIKLQYSILYVSCRPKDTVRCACTKCTCAGRLNCLSITVTNSVQYACGVITGNTIMIRSMTGHTHNNPHSEHCINVLSSCFKDLHKIFLA